MDVSSDSQYLSASKARHKLGVCSKTLRNWDSKGLINTVRTPTGVRLYDVQSIIPRNTRENPTTGHSVIYARVSSAKQKTDLDRQIQYLSEKFPKHKVVRDIGSGINWRRPGLKTILRYCLEGSIREVVVAHRDRLSRLGFELLQFIIEEAGGKLVVLGESSGKPSEFKPESELGEDLLSIIHVFSSRHYGRRKYRRKEGGGPEKDESKKVKKACKGRKTNEVQKGTDTTGQKSA